MLAGLRFRGAEGENMEITRSKAIWQIEKSIEEFLLLLDSRRNIYPFMDLPPEAIIFLNTSKDFSKSFQKVKQERVLYVLNNEGLLEFYEMIQELLNGFSEYPRFHNLYKSKIKIINDEIICKHEDGAVNVANYIINEIKVNAKSNIAKSISYILNYEARIAEWNNLNSIQKVLIPLPKPMFSEAVLLWANQVAPNRPWDHKPYIKQIFSQYAVERPLKSGTPSKSYYHKYKNHDYYYDIWSNIHYGYLGLICGFSEDQLLDGAGLAQYLQDGLNNLLLKSNEKPKKNGSNQNLRKFDGLADSVSINLGFSLYKKYGKYPENLTSNLLLEEIENLPTIEESRLIHICNDFTENKWTID